MKKRVLSVFLCIVLFITFFASFKANALSGRGGNISWQLDSNSGHLTLTGSGEMEQLVSSGQHPWNDMRENITSVYIGDGITSISDHAFSSCINLTYVRIPDSVVTIGNSAFDNTSLTSIVIPDSVTSMGSRVLSNNDYLQAVTLSSNLKSLGSNAFLHDTALTSIVIPGSLKTIPSSAFVNCHSLRDVTIEEGVELIGQSAFSGCGIQKLELPYTVHTIGKLAFSHCSLMESVNIPYQIKEIQEDTFNSCKSLKEIRIPYGVERIKARAFANCDSLHHVILPRSVAYFSSSAFYDIPQLYLVVLLDKHVYRDHDYDYMNYVGYAGSTTQKYAESQDYPFYPLSFDDVLPWQWYYDEVAYAAENGLMNGVDKYYFEPEESMSRAMLVTVLWRSAGSPEATESYFDDVEADQWYSQAVSWAAENGIVTGTGKGLFEPHSSVTREQIAVILHRYATAMGIDTENTTDLSAFPDYSSISPWAEEAMAWANAAGLISGTKEYNGTFLDPQSSATRAQVCTIMMRYIESFSE